MTLMIPISCSSVDPEDPDLPPAPVTRDTLASRVNIKIKSGIGEIRQFGTIDLFVFDDNGTRPLEFHEFREGEMDHTDVRCYSGSKLLVAIANSPYRFNTNSVKSFETLEQLIYKWEDDDPKQPILSGQATFKGGDGMDMQLEPVMCRIVLRRVSNSMSGYRRLEDPKVRLLKLNGSAEALRWKGFRPTDTVEASDYIELPYDVGVYGQEPNIELFCYPNDDDEASIGNERTVLELASSTKGESHNYEVKLPALRRNTSINVEISVSDVSEWTSNVE